MKIHFPCALLLLLLGIPLPGRSQLVLSDEEVAIDNPVSIVQPWTPTLTTYQAELGQVQSAVVGAGHSGYTGSGFVEYLTQQGSSSLTLEVSVPTAGTYELDTRYSTGVGRDQVRTLTLEANPGEKYVGSSTQARYPGTGAWNAWATQTSSLMLKAGKNVIRYSYGWSDNGWVNLDYIVVRTAAYEAATAQLSQANAGADAAGYTGSGYAENITVAGASSVTFTVQAPSAGAYGLQVRYAAAGAAERTMSVYVNGSDVTQARFPATGSWSKWGQQADVVDLKAGTNTITYRYDYDDNGWINMDYLQVAPLTPVVNNGWKGAATDFAVAIDSLTQHLDRAQVGTNILYDRVLPMAMLPSFSQGERPDTASARYFHQAYFELRGAAYTTAAFPLTPEALRAKGRRALRKDSVAIGVLDYRFNYLDTLAVHDGLLVEANRLYYGVAGAPRSPYLTANVTVAAALVDTVRTTTTFYVPAALLLGNRGRQVSSLLIDFGDGAGPVLCSPSQPRQVHYNEPGRKSIAYTIYFTDGSQVQCRSALYAAASTAVASRVTTAVALPLMNITATEAFAGYDGSMAQYGAGEALVLLQNPQSQAEYNANPASYRLRRPIIIVDGFDPQDASGLQDINQPGGMYDVVDRAGILAVAGGLGRDVILLNAPNSPRRLLNGAMTTDNVDGGSDYIERNALVLVTLINQLKPRLATGEKFAVIGPSMGGLISRYALAYMEKKQYERTNTLGLPPDPQWDHNTTLWVSLDSPHQGANVPIGTQEFLRYFQNHDADARDKFNTRLNTPAAKQMLVHHHSGGASALAGAPGFRDRFMLALRDNGRPNTLGYPELLRRVAITNGVLTGRAQAAGSPCGTALQMDKIVPFFRFTLFRPMFFYRRVDRGTMAIGDINFSPSYGSCYVFRGQIDPSVKLLTWTWHGPTRRNTSMASGIGSYDLAPGGWYDTQKQIVDGGSGLRFKNVVPNNCFIPAVSALGYQYQSMTNYQNTNSLPNPYATLGTNLVCTNQTPFDAYVGASGQNVQHVLGKDAGIDAFLQNELSGVTQTPAFVSAPSNICPGSSATFTLPASCGRTSVTYTWTLSNGLRFGNGQTTATGPSQVIYTPASASSGTVQVIATQQGMAPSAPLNYFVTSYAPEVAATYSCMGCYSGAMPVYTVNDVPAGRITLNVSSPVDCNFSSSNSSIPVTKTSGRSAYFDLGPYSNAQLQGVSITITPIAPATGTGCFASRTAVFRKPSSYRYAYAPNPVANDLVVTANDLGGSGLERSAVVQSAAFEAELYNSRGYRVRVQRSEKGQAILNLRDLPNGLYNLRVGGGEKPLSEHIVISH